VKTLLAGSRAAPKKTRKQCRGFQQVDVLRGKQCHTFYRLQSEM